MNLGISFINLTDITQLTHKARELARKTNKAIVITWEIGERGNDIGFLIS